ncbi:MAG: energy-coupling factor transporter transmembrane component T [Leucobacter sp.]
MTAHTRPVTTDARRSSSARASRSTAPRGWLTTINPLIKLAATFPALMLVLFTRDIATPAALAVIAVTALLTGVRVRPKVLLWGTVGVLLVGVWTTFLFAMLTRADLVADTPVVIDGWVTIRQGALETGAATALRLIAVSMLALLGSAGTSIAGLNSALVGQLRIPYRFAHGALAAACFAPRYREDLITLHAAHRARGIIDRRGPVGFARRTGRQVIPLLAGGARYAERLSLAMDARGFGAYPTRSDRNPARVRPRDIVCLVALWTAFAAVFISAGALGLAEWSSDVHGIA